jgi:ATP-dependent Lon protease
MAKSKLPVLSLPNPLILLPASRITFPISKQIGEAIYTLIDESDALPVIAAVPIINNNTNTTEPVLSEWGTAARVLRLVKPTSRNPRQPYILSLHGLTRVHLITSTNPSDFPVPNPVPIPPQDDLVLHDVEYPPTERTPSREAVDKFKHAGIRLLDRLARDSAQQLRKESYLKIAGMLEDITNARAPGMADVLVGAISGEYSDKLGSLQHI